MDFSAGLGMILGWLFTVWFFGSLGLLLHNAQRRVKAYENYWREVGFDSNDYPMKELIELRRDFKQAEREWVEHYEQKGY